MNWIWVRGEKACGSVEARAYTVHVTQIWSNKNVRKQCPLDPLFSQPYYPIENWSSANSHCVPLSENKRTKIDLEPLKWARGAAVYRWDHFISLLVAIYKHAKLRALHHNLRAKCRSSTCLITSPEHNFPAHRGGGRKTSLWQCQTMCVNNSTPYGRNVMQKEQPVGGSANALWLLLSAVQLYTLFL